jgi:hypothetical protein
MDVARGRVRAAVACSALVVLAALAVTAGCGNPDRLPKAQRLSQSPARPAAGTGSPSGFPDDQTSCDPDTDPVCFPTDVPTDTSLPTGYGNTSTYDPYGTDQFGTTTGTCPSTAPADTAVISEANRLSGGKLPAGVTVSDKQCAGSYLVADLTAPNLGTVQLVMRQNGSTWTGVAVGSYLCGSSALNGADDAKTLLNC